MYQYYFAIIVIEVIEGMQYMDFGLDQRILLLEFFLGLGGTSFPV